MAPKLEPDAIPNALALLASSYERDGCPIQAIHCLQALVNQQLPPDFEAKARLHLGRLLLVHTYNFKEASSNLQRAQILVRSLIGKYCLKYEIQDQLATCYHYLGEDAMELQAYTTAVSELPNSARSSSEWPAVCGWVCRCYQRAAALHSRCGAADEAAQAAQEGRAFAEANGMQQHRLVFLLLQLQLALGRWDHAAADEVLKALTRTLNEAAAALAAEAAEPGHGGAGVLDAHSYPHVLLHVNLLQVMYVLRLGKIKKDLVDPGPQQPPRQQPPPPPQLADGAAAAPPDMEAADIPLPPVLDRLENTLRQLKAAQQQQGQQQQGQQGQQGQGATALSRLPYTLPGLPTLEPLVCLVCATALRASGHRLVDGYLQRGLSCLSELLAAAGVDDVSVEESVLPRQSLEGARAALQLQLLLLESRAQVALSKAELRSAREDVLSCQQLQERFPSLLRALLPGVHLLTGQYCGATGELAAAVAHFQVARQGAPSRPAAAVAAVLEAQVHLSPPQQQPQGQGQQPQQQGQGGQQEAVVGAVGDVAAALAALGSFYAVREGMGGGGIASGGAGAAGGSGGGGGGESRPGSLGFLEESACLLSSASCLVQQGQLTEANTLLSRALKITFKQLGHTQLICAILNQLAPIFLAHNPPDTHSAGEAAKSATALSFTAGDLWAEAQGKRLLSDIARVKGEPDRAAAEAAAAARRQQRIATATAEALADSGRHGYAVGWGLRAGA